MCRCTSDSVTYMCVCVFFFRFFSIIVIQFSLVQSLSRDWLFVPPWTAACLPVHHQLSEPAQTHVHRIDDAIQPSDPPLSLSPAFNLSQHQGLFKWVSSSHQVAKVSSFSFNISPSNEYSVLISFRFGWFDHLAVQGTLKCLLQPHSSKASILPRSAFFIVQLSHPYMTTGKTIALTRQTFFQQNDWCLCFLICYLGWS